MCFLIIAGVYGEGTGVHGEGTGVYGEGTGVYGEGTANVIPMGADVTYAVEEKVLAVSAAEAASKTGIEAEEGVVDAVQVAQFAATALVQAEQAEQANAVKSMDVASAEENVASAAQEARGEATVAAAEALRDAADAVGADAGVPYTDAEHFATIIRLDSLDVDNYTAAEDEVPAAPAEDYDGFLSQTEPLWDILDLICAILGGSIVLGILLFKWGLARYVKQAAAATHAATLESIEIIAGDISEETDTTDDVPTGKRKAKPHRRRRRRAASFLKSASCFDRFAVAFGCLRIEESIPPLPSTMNDGTSEEMENENGDEWDDEWEDDEYDMDDQSLNSWLTWMGLKDPQSRPAKLVVGDRVKIIKDGTHFGHTAVVTDPDWNGMIKVDLDGELKSYSRLNLVRHADPLGTTTGTEGAESEGKDECTDELFGAHRTNKQTNIEQNNQIKVHIVCVAPLFIFSKGTSGDVVAVAAG
jgi:hypothetical protein